MIRTLQTSQVFPHLGEFFYVFIDVYAVVCSHVGTGRGNFPAVANLHVQISVSDAVTPVGSDAVYL